MILTTGVIDDLQQTIDLLVEACELPFSVIIVGIGNGDFTNMEKLDGDETLLSSSSGKKRIRDIVQFVPFNKYENDPKKLSMEVLAELPRQLVEFYYLKNLTIDQIKELTGGLIIDNKSKNNNQFINNNNNENSIYNNPKIGQGFQRRFTQENNIPYQVQSIPFPSTIGSQINCQIYNNDINNVAYDINQFNNSNQPENNLNYNAQSNNNNNYNNSNNINPYYIPSNVQDFDLSNLPTLQSIPLNGNNK